MLLQNWRIIYGWNNEGLHSEGMQSMYGGGRITCSPSLSLSGMRYGGGAWLSDD
jgi:hypothetical protein